jgi:hypothetical protein
MKEKEKNSTRTGKIQKIKLMMAFLSIVIIMLSISSADVLGISGSGGNISSNAIYASASYGTSGTSGLSIRSKGVAGMHLSGYYSAASLLGRFGLNNLSLLQDTASQNYPPQITILSPSPGTLSASTSNTISYSVTDINDNLMNCTLLISINNPPNTVINITRSIANSTTINIEYINSTNTIFYWRVNCTDGISSNISHAQNFTIDTVGPSIGLDYPSSEQIVTSSNIVFNYTPLDTNSINNCTLYVNNTGWNAMQTVLLPNNGEMNSFLEEILLDRDYKWNVCCYDIVGNSMCNSTNSSFSVNAHPPRSITALHNTESSDTSISWTWINPPDSDFNSTIIYIDSINIINLSKPINLYTATGLSPESPHRITVLTQDRALNVNSTNVTDTAWTTETPEGNPPVVVALLPLNNTGHINRTILFRYNVSDESSLSNCSLYLNDAINKTTNNPSEGINTFTIYNISIRSHVWNVTCTDNFDNRGFSATKYFTQVPASSFDNDSTDLSNTNISAVPNLTLAVQAKGKIIFPGITDLSSGADLDTHIKITRNSIVVNSSAIPLLNKSATLTMYEMPYNNILIWKDGRICTSFECNIVSFYGNTLVFNVSGFSNYTVTSTSSLRIYDDTDTTVKYPEQNINIFTNYSNTTSGQPLTGNCTITFNISGWSTPLNMLYNSTSKLFYYNTSYNESGMILYLVNCTTALLGFDNLSATDYVVLTPLDMRLAHINISRIQSSRTTINNPAQDTASSGGNITELTLNQSAVTKSWQGYYGNLSGKIILAAESNHSFYEWEISSPSGEIYATRTLNPSWANIRCANMPEMFTEDSALEIDSATSGESLNKTFFSNRQFPEFFIHTTNINSSQECYSTNLYVNSMPQNDSFHEILLYDNQNIIYTTLLEDDVEGFNEITHDFQMIVGENGQGENTDTSIYYFFVEVQ